MHQFELTEDQLQIQEMARKFTADAITPNAAEWDEKHIFPRDTIREAAELGFGAIYVSEESGGIGLGRLEAALIMEAMAYGCPSTSAFISIHNMASWMIDRFGSAEVKQKYLPSMITMEKIGSYCLTEPSSGSDAAALKTKAVLDGDHYVVSRLQGLHLRRRRERSLCDHGPHRRGGTEGHHRAGRRQGHEGRQLRRAGEEARLAFAADRAGQFRRGPRARRQPRRRRGRGLPHRHDGPRRRAPEHRRLLARRRAALPRRGRHLHQGPQAVRPADRRLPGDAVHARRHGDRAAGRALSALRRGGEGHGQRAGQDAVCGDGQAARDRHRLVRRRPRAAASRRLRLSAWTIRSSASGATCASTRSSKAPIRSCA